MARVLLLPCSVMLPHRRQTVIAIAAIISLEMPCGAAEPAAGAAPSIAVVPLADGDADERSREISRAVGDALSAATAFRVVDAGLVDRVLSYHGGAGEADTAIPEAEAALERAKESYFRFRSDEAQAEAARAVSLLDARPGEISATGPLLVDALVTQAVIARSRGDLKLAREALARALRIHPVLDLTSQEYPPSLVTLFEEERERAALASVPRGTVAVSTVPAAAELFLNGMPAGTTPAEFEVPAGDYRLLIRTNRYGAVEREIRVAGGARVAVRERLSWKRDSAAPASPESDAAEEVRKGLRIAEILKVDKVVFIDADAGSRRIGARLVDRALQAGQSPIAVRTKGDEPVSADLAELTRAIAGQAAVDIAADPARAIDPKGIADPALLGKRRRPFVKSPLFWGVIGALVAGGVGGGLAAAMSGGGGDRGSVRVEFR